MIYRKDGYLSDITGDLMDSSMRQGVYSTFQIIEPARVTTPSITNYVKDGICVRHPSHFPSNNPKNFTRDQLIPLMAGLYHSGHYNLCRDVFYAHAKRLFFCQNIERDIPGSRKYPWPHAFWKDSRPESKQMEYRAFDWSDPLFVHHIFFLILCARIWWLYPLGIIALPVFAFSLVLGSKKIDVEQNQVQCMTTVYGKWAERLYLQCNKMWREQTAYYWVRRYEAEYAEAIINYFTKGRSI